jgi:hypothetical protein
MAANKLLSNLNFNGNPAINFSVEQFADDPDVSSGFSARLYYNTTNKEYRFFDGTSWIPIAESDIKFDDVTIVKNTTTKKREAYAVLSKDALPSPCDKPNSLFLFNDELYFYDGSAYIKIMSKCPFPVGSVYISIGNSNPSTIWSGTTWDQLATGTTLWNTTTGGGTALRGALPSLPEPTVADAGAHNHTVAVSLESNIYTANGNYWGKPYNSTRTTSTAGNHTHSVSFASGTVYGMSSDDTVRPTSIAVCMWQRTA